MADSVILQESPWEKLLSVTGELSGSTCGADSHEEKQVELNTSQASDVLMPLPCVKDENMGNSPETSTDAFNDKEPGPVVMRESLGEDKDNTKDLEKEKRKTKKKHGKRKMRSNSATRPFGVKRTKDVIRRDRNAVLFECFKQLTEIIGRRDEFSSFGELVACRLRNSNRSSIEICLAQYRIQTILFNLGMGVYERELNEVENSLPLSDSDVNEPLLIWPEE